MTPRQSDSFTAVRSDVDPSQPFGTPAREEAKDEGDMMGKALKRLVQTSWQLLGCFVYLCRRRLPHAKGYRHYRDRYVRGIIGNNELLQVFNAGRELPENFGARLDERVVEYPWVLSRLARYKEKSQFLDAGSTLNHEAILQHPAVKTHKWNILTLSPEPKCFWDLGVSYLYEDLRCVPFKDEWFDAVTCISVIEHIGMDNKFFSMENAYRENRPHDYLRAVEEMRRIIRPGGWLFLTVPFGRYEDHGWLQQFDSRMLSALISEFQPQKANKTFFRYTAQGWKLATEDQCGDLAYFDVNASKFSEGPEGKRFDPDFAAAARGVACVELQK